MTTGDPLRGAGRGREPAVQLVMAVALSSGTKGSSDRDLRERVFRRTPSMSPRTTIQSN